MGNRSGKGQGMFQESAYAGVMLFAFGTLFSSPSRRIGNRILISRQLLTLHFQSARSSCPRSRIQAEPETKQSGACGDCRESLPK